MQHAEFVGHTTHQLHMGFAGTTAEMPQRETATSGSAASALRGSGLHRLFFDATLERNSKVT